MRNEVYRSAVDQLRFCDNLETAVLEKSNVRRRKTPVLYKLSIAAAVTVLLATTAFASDLIIERGVRIREIGLLKSDFANAQIMEFTLLDSMQDISVHQMELKPKGYYLLGKGMLFHPSEGFFRVTDDYRLEAIEDTVLNLLLKKDKLYSRILRYVSVDGGIVDDQLGYYPVNGNTVLVNLEAEDGNCWPVYVNIETGKCRDVLSGLSERDFWPENIPEGYEVQVKGGQPFRDGILMHTIVSGVRNGNSDGEDIYFWIQKGTGYPVRLDMSECHIAFVVSDTLYYMDQKGNYYEMDDLCCFHKIDMIPDDCDMMNLGLVTVQNENGTIDIYDLYKGEIFRISGLNTQTEGYDATRNSINGRIMLIRDVPDWTQMERRVCKLGVLDMENGCLQQITIASEYNIQTHGWLDDERYFVIYEEGLQRYLRIYEFS